MTSTLDSQSFALGCLLGGVVAFVLAAAIGGWLERRKGPRGMIVRYLPRHPEDDVMEALLDGHERRIYSEHRQKKETIQ